jgi:hypothetical protein
LLPLAVTSRLLGKEHEYWIALATSDRPLTVHFLDEEVTPQSC